MNKYQRFINTDFKQQCLSALENYWEIEESIDYDVNIEWKNRKYIKLISEKTELDLVDALRSITGYSFFIFEDNYFHCQYDHLKKRKKDIYYDPNEIGTKWFLISLLHEVWHFPRIYELWEIWNEKIARFNSIKIATALKNQYNFCCLAWFQWHNDVYNYINEYLLTQSNSPWQKELS